MFFREYISLIKPPVPASVPHTHHLLPYKVLSECCLEGFKVEIPLSWAVGEIFKSIKIIILLLQPALQPLVGFRPAQLSLIIFSRTVLQSAVANGTSNPQLGGEPGI
jgi:hypothetical protein